MEPIVYTLSVSITFGVSDEVRLAALFDQVVAWHLNDARLGNKPPEETHGELARVCAWLASRHGANQP